MTRSFAILAFLFVAVAQAQSVSFAKDPNMTLPKLQNLEGYKINYTAKKPGTIYLEIRKDGKAIGNGIYEVTKAGTNTVPMNIWIWEGPGQLSRGCTYSYTLSMWEDPKNVFNTKAADAPEIKNVCVGKPKKKKKKKKNK